MLGKWIGVAMGKLLLQLVPGMWLSAALAPVPSRMRQRAPSALDPSLFPLNLDTHPLPFIDPAPNALASTSLCDLAPLKLRNSSQQPPALICPRKDMLNPRVLGPQVMHGVAGKCSSNTHTHTHTHTHTQW